MNRIKRLLVLAIAAIILASSAACSQNDPQSTPAPAGTTPGTSATEPANNGDTPFDPMAKYDPPITISTAVYLDDEMQTFMGLKEGVLENNNWMDAYAEDLGISITYDWAVPNAQYEQKVNTTIVANDLPDIIAVNASQLRLLVENGMVADLTDVFEQYATPFTKEMMEADSWIGIGQATFDGRLMALPRVDGNVDNANMLWIRNDWLEALGRTAPATIDELIDLAKAFMEADLDGTGQAYGLGAFAGWGNFLEGGFGELTPFFQGHGAYPQGWVDVNGKAEFGRVQPVMRGVLEKLAEMYADGILHREFATRDLTEDVTAGRVGLLFGQHWLSFWPLQLTIDNNPEADWIPCPIPTVDGSPAKPMLGGSAGLFYVVNPDFANPEAVVKLYNYYYDKDCALSPNYDGDRFHIAGDRAQDEPEATWQWAVVKSFYPIQNLFIFRGLREYLATGNEDLLEIGWISDAVDSLTDYLEDPIANAVRWGAYRWSGPGGAFSVIDQYQAHGNFILDLITYTTDSMVEYNTTLNDMAYTTFTKIIMGVDPIEAFDTYVSDWHTLGGDKITAEVNFELGR